MTNYQQYLDPRMKFQTQGYSNLPLINSLIPTGTSNVFTQPSRYTDLMDWFKVTPECISLVQGIVTDVLSDGYYFEGPKSRMEAAEEFALANYLDTVLEGWLFDKFVEGSGFMWKKKPDAEAVKEFVEKFVKENRFFYKEEVKEVLYKKALDDEDAMRTKALRNVAATTMNIIPSDIYGSEYYFEQRVGAHTSRFLQDEIIHIKDLNLNGELYGYSRMRGILSEVQMLGLMKDYQGSFFQNFGMPEGVVNLPQETPDSPNYNLVKSVIEQSKQPKERHRVMLFTGEVSWTMFERMKDMEFKNLADFLFKIIAMCYQVPPSRYGGTGQSSEETNLSNQAYYRNISHLQSKIESVLNRELWIPEFKVKMRFNRSYKEDEVREAQIEKIMTDVAQQRLILGMITPEAAADYLHVPHEQRPKKLGQPQVDPSIVAKKFGQFNPGQSSEDALLDEPQQNRNKNKTPKGRSAFSEVR